MNCECNNKSNRVKPGIKHVYGNVLRMAIPLTLRTLVKDGDEMNVTDTDFVPSSDHPVRVVLSKGKTKYPIIATMDGNVAIVEDKGKIPVGTYDISVECYDDLGNPYRFKQNAVLYVADTTAEAGIDEEIEYEAQTWYLNAAVFLATTEIGEIGDAIDAKLDDVFGNVAYDANAKEIRFYNKGNSRVLATIDSRPFITDGTVADVYIDVSRQVLVVVLNEDAGGRMFSVPLYLIFNSYYKKDEVDSLLSNTVKGLRFDFSQELPLVVPVTKNGSSISSTVDFGAIDNAIREDGRIVVACVNNSEFYQLLDANRAEVSFSQVNALDGYQELLIVDPHNVWSMEDVNLGTGGGGGYEPPAGGIPKSDLAQSVQDTLDAVDGKVDKETGKGLSTNDYTTAEKTKLAGIAAGAEVNVQANWTQTNTSADDYIKNKPTLATVATSGSYNDLSDKPTIPAAVTVDSTITQNGTNPVQGSAIYSALAKKTETEHLSFEYDDAENTFTFYNSDGDIITNSEFRDICNSKYVFLHDDGNGVSLIPTKQSHDNWIFYGAIGGTDVVYVPIYWSSTQNRVDGDYFYDTQVPDTRKINNKALSSDITLTASDVGAVPTTRTINDKFLSDNITLTVSDIGAIPTVISTTYNDLVTVRTNSQLIEGAWYRITDYTCTTSQTDTQSAGHQFDILVQAISPNRLSEEAKAIRHEGDTYFAHSNLEAWKIWYCLDNDNARFSWAEPAEGKGVIYRMIDEWNNECPYDFKNIQFKRYQLKNQNYLYASKALWDNDGDTYGNEVITNFHNIFAILYNNLGTSINDNTIPFYYTRGMHDEYYIVDESEIYGYNEIYETYRDNSGNTIALSESGTRKFVAVYNLLYDYYDIILEVNDTDGEWMYTFSRKNGINIPPIDNSLNGKIFNNKFTNFTNSRILFDNVFISYNSNLFVQNNTFGNYFQNNTFGNYFQNNTFGNGCGLNTFGHHCSSNIFGNECYNNSFGNFCISNIFGNECFNNSFGDDFQYNTFGNHSHENSFGNGCASNSFRNDCSANTFGNSLYDNTFGSGCNSNTFGNSYSANTFGNNCTSNTFGNSCSRNSFGNNCTSNTFGNYVNYNTFGNNCWNVTFSKDYTRYVIVENGNQRITLTSTETTSSSNLLRNITIAQGVNNTSTTKTISHNTLNDTFRTTYTTDVNGNIYAIVPAKYAEWDNKQSTLISGTNIKTINNQSLLGSGNLTASDIGALPSNTHIPTDQVQSNWNETNTSSKAYIQNKPTIPDTSTLATKTELNAKQDAISDLAAIRSGASKGATAIQQADLAAVATSGSYNDLSNKPTIPAAQVNADWNATSGVSRILNKPTIPTVPTKVSSFTNDAGYLTQHQSLANYYTKSEIDSKIGNIETLLASI